MPDPGREVGDVPLRQVIDHLRELAPAHAGILPASISQNGNAGFFGTKEAITGVTASLGGNVLGAVELSRLDVFVHDTLDDLPVSALELADVDTDGVRLTRTEGLHTGPGRIIEADFDILEGFLSDVPLSRRQGPGIAHHTVPFPPDATISEVAQSDRVTGDFMARLMSVSILDRYVSHFGTERELQAGHEGAAELHKQLQVLYERMQAGKLLYATRMPGPSAGYLVPLMTHRALVSRLINVRDAAMPGLSTVKDIARGVQPASSATPFVEGGYVYDVVLGRQRDRAERSIVTDPAGPFVLENFAAPGQRSGADTPLDTATELAARAERPYQAVRERLTRQIRPLGDEDITPIALEVEHARQVLGFGQYVSSLRGSHLRPEAAFMARVTLRGKLDRVLGIMGQYPSNSVLTREVEELFREARFLDGKS